MLFSTDSLAALPPGKDYSEAFVERGELHDLVETQQVVFLGTGSPQLNYRFLLEQSHRSNADPIAHVYFGMRVGAAGVSIRDGYAVMDWQRDDPEVRLQVPRGYYKVDASWRECTDSLVDMLIALSFAPSTTTVSGDGWPYLEFHMDATSSNEP